MVFIAGLSLTCHVIVEVKASEIGFDTQAYDIFSSN